MMRYGYAPPSSYFGSMAATFQYSVMRMAHVVTNTAHLCRDGTNSDDGIIFLEHHATGQPAAGHLMASCPAINIGRTSRNDFRWLR